MVWPEGIELEFPDLTVSESASSTLTTRPIGSSEESAPATDEAAVAPEKPTQDIQRPSECRNPSSSDETTEAIADIEQIVVADPSTATRRQRWGG